MAKFYRVSLCGENVFLNVAGKTERYGFFVNIFVCTENKSAALTRATELIQNRLLHSRSIDNRCLDIIELSVEDIAVYSEMPEGCEQGFVWYRNDKMTN